MNKVLFLLLMTGVALNLVSCEKERGSAEACFDYGTSSLKAGTPVHFMNCSRNYDYTKWAVLDQASNLVFEAPTDTLEHLVYNFPAGTFNVRLRVVQGDSVSVAEKIETIVINP